MNSEPYIMEDARFLSYHGSSKELTDILRKKLNLNRNSDFSRLMDNNDPNNIDVLYNYIKNIDPCQNNINYRRC